MAHFALLGYGELEMR